MDNKQEVMAVLRELAVWDIPAEGNPNIGGFYDRIAQMMKGEFDEVMGEYIRETADLAHEKWGSLSDQEKTGWISGRLFRLNHIAGLCKKVCQVCGGKRGKSTIDRLRQGDWFLCPGCQQVVFIPDEEIFKQPCQHKYATRHEKPMPLPYCPDCATYFDQRSGKERREVFPWMPRRGSIGRRVYDGLKSRRDGLVVPITISTGYSRRRGTEDRRDGKDRRASQS